MSTKKENQNIGVFIENELRNWMKDVVNAHVRLSDAANSASVEVTSMLAEEIVFCCEVTIRSISSDHTASARRAHPRPPFSKWIAKV